MHLLTATESEQPQSYSYIKAIVSGTLIEVIEYEKAPAERKERRKESRAERKPTKRARRNVARAKASFRRLVRSTLNLGAPAFITLTMVDICDITTAYKYFTKFTSKARKSFGNELAWIAVPEFQRRGAVHFHCLVWGLKNETIEAERYTRDIQACWGRGWLDILKSDGSPKIAGYMAKYMSKTMLDERIAYKKAYSSSRNCLRSKSYRIRTSITQAKESPRERWGRLKRVVPVDKSTGHPVFEKLGYNEWLGRCRVRIYETNK